MNNIKTILKKLKINTKQILIEKQIKKKIKANKILNIKIGLDPTTPNLHLGHFVLIKKIKQLQELGHNILFLLGDFTGIIGDPTGKNLTRQILTKKQTKINAIKCKHQLIQLLNPNKTKFLFNSEWLKRISLFRLINIFSKITIYKMLERKDFKKRYQHGASISMHEFVYPLIQAYDSVVLKADIEIGGNDQLFNLLIGRELQKLFDQEPQNIITMPILEGFDGTKKMSKSLNNFINFKDKPGDMYRKIVSINDNLLYKYLILLSIKTKPIKKHKTLKTKTFKNHKKQQIKTKHIIINSKHKTINTKQIKQHKKINTTINNHINKNINTKIKKPNNTHYNNLFKQSIKINNNKHTANNIKQYTINKHSNKYIKQNLIKKPRELKCKLALELITYFYNKTIANKASNFIGNKVTTKKFPMNIPKIQILIKTFIKVTIIYLLNKSGLVKNNSQAKDLLKHNKLKINNITINLNYKLVINNNYFLQIGNKIFAIIQLLGP